MISITPGDIIAVLYKTYSRIISVISFSNLFIITVNTIGSSEISQWIPSLLNPAKISILIDLLSQRNIPAYPSSNGTTALLKMLFEFLVAKRSMIGFAYISIQEVYRFRPCLAMAYPAIAFPTILLIFTVLPTVYLLKIHQSVTVPHLRHPGILHSLIPL